MKWMIVTILLIATAIVIYRSPDRITEFLHDKRNENPEVVSTQQIDEILNS